MTRQEEIRNAVDTIVPILPTNNGRTYEQALMASGFEEGVKWADANPKSPWISVEDDLPCNHRELINPAFPINTKYVLVQFESGVADMSKMIKYNNNDWKWVHKIVRWMPIPKLPKE